MTVRAFLVKLGKEFPMEEGEEGSLRICLVTFPFASATTDLFLLNFLEIVESISDRLYVITGKMPESKIPKKVHVKEVKVIVHYKESIRPIWWSVLLWISKNIAIQMKISYEILKIAKEVDIVIILGVPYCLLPLVLAKLMGKKTVVAVWGRGSKSLENSYGKRNPIVLFLKLLESINFSVADQIAVQSKSAVHFLGLTTYESKITINGATYIDTTLFKIKNEIPKRRYLAGYVGRLVEEKGVMNFVRAMPILLKTHPRGKILIVGDGKLLSKIVQDLRDSGVYDRVTLTGWVPRDKLPDYLNNLKLLVFPSYSEGLPGIVQEAMACGTLVLATPVGGIPDLIQNGKTGFILENNSPEYIAANIIRALCCPKLNVVTRNARKLIEEEYVYEPMVQKCKSALYKLVRAEALYMHNTSHRD